MKFPWFKRYGLLFYPISFVGRLILIAALFISVSVFLTIDENSHSVSDTLMSFAINLLIIYFIYSFIAFIASKHNK